MKIPTQKEGHSYKVVPITKRGNRSKDVYPHDNSSDKEVGKLTRIALAHTLDRQYNCESRTNSQIRFLPRRFNQWYFLLISASDHFKMSNCIFTKLLM